MLNPAIGKETVDGFLFKFKRLKSHFQLSDFNRIQLGRVDMHESETSS